MGEPQVVGITVGITQASDFEHLMGGADFTVSLLCGTTSVLDNDPQSIGSICEL
jgi:type IV secretory pathway TrbD component